MEFWINFKLLWAYCQYIYTCTKKMLSQLSVWIISHWVTLLCTMGDNPYKYCNLQWEIIHTLLSCDNIFFVHVLYVFSLVLFCLLMIVQCLDFKSIQLLLLYYYHTLQIMGCKVYTFSWCSIIFIEFRSFVLSKKL